MKKYAEKGFTLIELLLVMVIIMVIIVTSNSYVTQKTENMRIDKTALQMQYILNAALAYYVANGKWPGNSGQWYITAAGSSPLQPNYLPNTGTPNPWGVDGPDGWMDHYYWNFYVPFAYSNIPANTFQVWVYMGITPKQQALAKVIAGKLPRGYVTVPSDPYYGYAIGYVDVPGQNLSNSTAVNFAGLYHHGACVPVPTCPSPTAGGGTTTSPQIFVAPVSVSGVNDPSSSSHVYPISSFTAYSTAPGATPTACAGGTAAVCTPINGNAPQSGQYWRVCLQVITQRGDIGGNGSPGNLGTRADAWGNLVTMAAFTRCAISNEPGGSTFAVFTH